MSDKTLKYFDSTDNGSLILTFWMFYRSYYQVASKAMPVSSLDAIHFVDVGVCGGGFIKRTDCPINNLVIRLTDCIQSNV